MIYLIITILIGHNCMSNELNCKRDRIDEVLILTLPEIITSVGAIDTEEKFDKFSEKIDTAYFALGGEFKIELGEKMDNYNFLDIRTKVVINYVSGKQKKYFFDSFGHIMFENSIYQGSYELLALLRHSSSPPDE